MARGSLLFLVFGSLTLVAAFPRAAAAQMVNCGNGGNLQSAIYAAREGGTVRVAGHCNRGPYYVYKDLNLVGEDGNATLSAPSGDRVLYVTGAKVSVERLRIDASGSWFGIIFEERAKGALSGVTVENASGPGVLVFLTSYASIVNSRVRNNSIGIDVVSSSSAWIVDSEASGNTAYGIQTRKSSALDIINTRSSANLAGVVVDESSSAELANAIVTGNSGPGVWIPHTSVVRFTGSVSTIESNGLDVQCGRGATALFDAPQSSATKTTSFDAACIVENAPFLP